MNGVTREDRIENRYIRGTVKVIEVSKKVQEARLRWFGHLMRRTEEDHVAKGAMEMDIPGTRNRGRPRKRWRDSIREDMREKGLLEEQTQERREWRRLIYNGDPE